MKKGQSRVDSKYHSGLSGPVKGLKRVGFFSIHDSVAFAWDVLEGRLPKMYSECDVFYSDLAWKAGFERFNERAGVKDQRSFAQYMEAVSKIIMGTRAASVIVTGKHAERYLPNHCQALHSTLNGLPCMVYVYNTKINCKDETTIDILKYMASRYKRVGDFCCGYGRSGRIFARHGKSFVMSDFNPECIGYIAQNAERWFR